MVLHVQLQHGRCPHRSARPSWAVKVRDTQVCRVAIGPQPPPRQRKPEWVRILEEDADVDEDVARLLEGTGGDPQRIRSKMQVELESKSLLISSRAGVDAPPSILFREVDNFDLWLWFEFYTPPAERERELLDSVLKSWYVLGKLGGYNSQNLQVYYNAAGDQSHMDYVPDDVDRSMDAYIHSMGDLEWRGQLARVHVDLGTADELAMDVLLNTLTGFSRECVGIQRISVGGSHDSWPLGDKKGEEGKPRRDRRDGVPKTSIDPMRMPDPLDEDELALMDQFLAMQEDSEAAGVRDVDAEGAEQAGGVDADWVRQQREALTARRGDGAGDAATPEGMGSVGDGVRMYSPEEFRQSFPNRGP